jgi:hypothetical protein
MMMSVDPKVTQEMTSYQPSPISAVTSPIALANAMSSGQRNISHSDWPIKVPVAHIPALRHGAGSNAG